MLAIECDILFSNMLEGINLFLMKEVVLGVKEHNIYLI